MQRRLLLWSRGACSFILIFLSFEIIAALKLDLLQPFFFFLCETRYQYLSNAVLQAKSASSSIGSSNNSIDDGLLDMLEAKLVVLRFQMKIKVELESMASRLQDLPESSRQVPNDPFPQDNIVADVETAKAARDKAKELSLNLKSITQLYNDYAVPFKLWEVCISNVFYKYACFLYKIL